METEIEVTPKFKPRDNVRVIKYGHLAWVSDKSGMDFSWAKKLTEKDGVIVYDVHNELVGKTGVVKDCTIVQGQAKYSLTGISGKSSWYNEDQLELV